MLVLFTVALLSATAQASNLNVQPRALLDIAQELLQELTDFQIITANSTFYYTDKFLKDSYNNFVIATANGIVDERDKFFEQLSNITISTNSDIAICLGAEDEIEEATNNALHNMQLCYDNTVKSYQRLEQYQKDALEDGIIATRGLEEKLGSCAEDDTTCLEEVVEKITSLDDRISSDFLNVITNVDQIVIGFETIVTGCGDTQVSVLVLKKNETLEKIQECVDNIITNM